MGKTTLAAATAVHLARQGQRVLITSTDPAHSLSDVFDRSVGHQGARIEPRLTALEVDSSARWGEATAPAASTPPGRGRRGKVQNALADAMKALGDAPGVDEFVSLELLLETMASDAHDTVVFDTAPTGHTLRLLLLPQMLDGWIGRLLTLRRQFARLGRTVRRMVGRKAAPGEELTDNLQAARDHVTMARELIMNPLRTAFALVTIPEAMSILETQRTLEQLAAWEIPVATIIANQVQPASATCDHCNRRHRIHQDELARLAGVAGSIPVRQIPARAEVIRGPDALARLGAALWHQAE